VTDNVPWGIPTVAIADANILLAGVSGNYILDTDFHKHLVKVVWSEFILTEVVRHYQTKYANSPVESARHFVSALSERFPFSLIPVESEHQKIARDLGHYPDEDDVNIVAAAIASDANLIITNNESDFPPENLAKADLQALSGDKFLSLMLELYPEEMLDIFDSSADKSNSRNVTGKGGVHDELCALIRSGAGGFAAAVADARGYNVPSTADTQAYREARDVWNINHRQSRRVKPQVERQVAVRAYDKQSGTHYTSHYRKWPERKQ
jgi:predicted nucleic acid-binding protein